MWEMPYPREGVFPARAGMILGSDGFSKPCLSIPRESGDDPTFTPLHSGEDGYSPRERG